MMAAMKAVVINVFKDRKIFPFLISVLGFGLVTGLYTGVLNNYLHDILGMKEAQRGFLEFPRELPGLLLVLFMALFYRFSEFKILRLALLFSLFGLIGLSLFGTLQVIAIMMIFFWSLGEHLLMPIRQSIAVHHAQPGKAGLAMGAVRGVHNAGQALGFYLAPLFILLLAYFKKNNIPFDSYRLIFLISAALLSLAFILTRVLKDDSAQVPRKRIYFHKKFTRYYFLEIFYGARKQVFITFAPFVLIVHYQARVEWISLLYGIWSVVNIFIGPLVGKLLDKWGYKKILVFDALILVALCLLYGFAGRLLSFQAAFILTSVVFVLDSMAFALGMARDMYAKSKSVDKEEFTATLSTGLSVNHLISIIIAVAGGIIWKELGVEVLFSVAALIGVGAFFFSLSLEAPEGI